MCEGRGCLFLAAAATLLVGVEDNPGGVFLAVVHAVNNGGVDAFDHLVALLEGIDQSGGFGFAVYYDGFLFHHAAFLLAIGHGANQFVVGDEELDGLVVIHGIGNILEGVDNFGFVGNAVEDHIGGVIVAGGHEKSASQHSSCKKHFFHCTIFIIDN